VYSAFPKIICQEADFPRSAPSDYPSDKKRARCSATGQFSGRRPRKWYGAAEGPPNSFASHPTYPTSSAKSETVAISGRTRVPAELPK
jgi:hypothetical protein